MTWEMATTTTQVARKEYHCDLLHALSDLGFPEDDFAAEDWQIIEAARAEGWMIRKGAEYVKTSGKWDGEFCVFRARKDIFDVCRKDYIRDLFCD